MPLIIIIILLSVVGCHSMPPEEKKDESLDPHATYRNNYQDVRRINVIYQDEELSNKILLAIKSTGHFNNSNLRVITYNQIILLLGQTPTVDQRHQAFVVATQFRGKRRVVNRISIEGPVSTLTHTSDTWISTKVKAQLISRYALKAAQFKVTTENGVVYLLGKVSAHESALATRLARETEGVRKVVTLFEYQ